MTVFTSYGVPSAPIHCHHALHKIHILYVLYHRQVHESDDVKRLQLRCRPLGMLLHMRGLIENISRWDSPTAWCYRGTLRDDER